MTLCVGLEHGLEHRSHTEGKSYYKPKLFSLVLHDNAGCLFITKARYEELLQQGAIEEKNSGKQQRIFISDGIAAIPGYRQCAQKESCPKRRSRQK